MDPTLKWWAAAGVLVWLGLLLVFAGVYTLAFEAADFQRGQADDRSPLAFVDGWCMSVSTQTLLGHNDITPVSTAARVTVSIQAVLTFSVALLTLPWLIAITTATTRDSK